MNRTCELDLPAGSLQCALYAFKGGADAVYLGLKSFSARKGAVNFSFEDVRKLKALCSPGGMYEGKKFYITLNTLASDRDIAQIITLLKQLQYIGPDGIIVQDLGVARIIHERFPSLPLHGSTQLAVHTADGVRELKRLGFSRVVLARELSFDEIRDIKKACPDVELKVFIHGALCYGFSGICMASQFMAGRGNDKSANRGSCAQICRTWFHCTETGTDSWLFSMKDLCMGEKVRAYAEAGVESLKIEGRMKGPDYAYWCARYYRLILDGKNEDDREVSWAKEAMQVCFSRETTDFFFGTGHSGSMGAQNMVCSTDPGHKGIRVGTIDRVLNGKAVVRFSKAVAIRDGLKVVFADKGALPKMSCFSLSFIEGGKSFISEGETATINFPTSDFDRKPSFGTPVYCISRHDLNPGVLNENLSLYKKPMDITVRIDKDGFSINGMKTETDVQEAKSGTDTAEVLKKILSASDKSFFTLGELSVDNRSGFENPFIPLSVLKQTRRAFYEDADKAFSDELDKNETVEIPAPASRSNPALPPRSSLGLWDEVIKTDKGSFLPLSPVMFNEEEYLKTVEKKLEENPDTIVGLNNIAQVLWAKEYLASGHDVKFFADVFLYTQNTTSYLCLLDEVPSLIGSYELDEDTPFNYTGKDYVPPLFVSRVCLRHNGLDLPCKGCSKDNTFHLEQNGKHYKAICRNCITVLLGDS